MSPLPLPEKLQHLTTEIGTLYRELPRLIREGQAGRVALVRGDSIEVYDSDDDAMEVAAFRWGFGPYLIQPIKADDVTHLAPYFPPPAGEMRA